MRNCWSKIVFVWFCFLKRDVKFESWVSSTETNPSFWLVFMIFVHSLFRSQSLSLKRAWILQSSSDISRGKNCWCSMWVSFKKKKKSVTQWKDTSDFQIKKHRKQWELKDFSLTSHTQAEIRILTHFHSANHYPACSLFISRPYSNKWKCLFKHRLRAFISNVGEQHVCLNNYDSIY